MRLRGDEANAGKDMPWKDMAWKNVPWQDSARACVRLKARDACGQDTTKPDNCRRLG